MIHCGKIGLTLQYRWQDGTVLMFRLAELFEPSVIWLIAFVNSQNKELPLIENPKFLTLQEAV